VIGSAAGGAVQCARPEGSTLASMQGQLSERTQPIAAAILSPYCGRPSSTTLRSLVLGKMKSSMRCLGKEGALSGAAFGLHGCEWARFKLSSSDFASVATLLLRRWLRPILQSLCLVHIRCIQLAYARLHSHFTMKYPLG